MKAVWIPDLMNTIVTLMISDKRWIPSPRLSYHVLGFIHFDLGYSLYKQSYLFGVNHHLDTLSSTIPLQTKRLLDAPLVFRRCSYSSMSQNTTRHYTSEQYLLPADTVETARFVWIFSGCDLHDKFEPCRLNHQHAWITQAFENRLHIAPVSLNTGDKVLESAAGSGNYTPTSNPFSIDQYYSKESGRLNSKQKTLQMDVLSMWNVLT